MEQPQTLPKNAEGSSRSDDKVHRAGKLSHQRVPGGVNDSPLIAVVSKIERTAVNPSLEVLQKLANQLDVGVVQLLLPPVQ
jgi:transcriptional regulator with XRE-family HTH domain